MACPPVRTGERFLEAALTHVDCQAQSIGAYGYGALSDPGSAISLALTGILVIFVAIFGIRIATGYPFGARDLPGDVIRLIIVLTLATSWPAWRVVGYELVIGGPAEISRTVGLSAELPGSGGDLTSRLQRVDDGLATLNERGVGRRGVANGDWFQLGFARTAFLTGTIGPLALLRLTAGILLAIAPLVAGLLLFGITRSIFAGWAKGLAATFLATVIVSLVLAVELALIEPWLEGVIRLRSANQQTLSAPVEALIITLAFALICFGAIAVAARIVFNPSISFASYTRNEQQGYRVQQEPAGARSMQLAANDRGGGARIVASAVAGSIDRDQRLDRDNRGTSESGPKDVRTAPEQVVRSVQTVSTEALGSTYRRNSLRSSRPGIARDQAG